MRVEDYSIALYGLHGLDDVSPDALKRHVEMALKSHADKRLAYFQSLRSRETARKHPRKLRVDVYDALVAKWEEWIKRRCHRVADVTMIVRDRGLLRRLVTLAPVEARVPTLKRRLDIARHLSQSDGARARSGWQGCAALGDRMGFGDAAQVRRRERRLKAAQQRLLHSRRAIDGIAALPLKPLGAFVTFEYERARHVALKLWRPISISTLCMRQPAYAKFPIDSGAVSAPSSAKSRPASTAEAPADADEGNTTNVANGAPRFQRLFALPAPRPQNVRYENLSVRFDVQTKLRRCCANVILILVILVGFAVSLVAVTTKVESARIATALATAATAPATSNATFAADAVEPSSGLDWGKAGSSMWNTTATGWNTTDADGGAADDEANVTSTAAVNAVNATTRMMSGMCSPKQGALLSSAIANPLEYLSMLSSGPPVVDANATAGMRESTYWHMRTSQELLSAFLACQLTPLLRNAVTMVIVVLNLVLTLSIKWLVAFSRCTPLLFSSSPLRAPPTSRAHDPRVPCMCAGTTRSPTCTPLRCSGSSLPSL